MNKRLLIYLVITLSSLNLSAQEIDKKSKQRYYINAPWYLTSFAPDGGVWLFTPQAGIGISKSNFYIGPSFYEGKLSGGIFTYQIYPNDLGHTFNFFFQADLYYQQDSYEYSIWSFSKSTYVHVKQTETDYGMTIGYGFQVDAGQLYLSSHFSLGYEFITYNLNPADYNPYYFHHYDDRVAVSVSVGLGFKFEK